MVVLRNDFTSFTPATSAERQMVNLAVPPMSLHVTCASEASSTMETVMNTLDAHSKKASFQYQTDCIHVFGGFINLIPILFGRHDAGPLIRHR